MTGYGAIWDLRLGKPVLDFHNDFQKESKNFVKKDFQFKSSLNNIHSKKINSSSFDSTGCFLSTASDDLSVKIWDLRKQKYITSIPAHIKKILKVEFLQNNNFLISSDIEGNIKYWDWYNSQIVKEIKMNERKMSAIAFNKKRDIFFAGFLSKKLIAYDSN